MSKRRLITIVALIFADIAVSLYNPTNIIVIIATHLLIIALVIKISTIGTRLGKNQNAMEEKLFTINSFLRENRRLDTILDNIPCTVGAITPQYEIVMVNNELTRLLGVKKQEIIGKRCFDVFGAGRICANCPVPRTLVTKAVQYNTRQEHSCSGNKIIFGQTAVPILGGDGEVEYVLEFGIDITQKVELEQEKTRLFVETVTSLAKLIESRDKYTGTHSAKVRDIAVAVGRQMGLEPEVINELSIAAILHDVGKIGIPEHILNKAGSLTAVEYETIKRHPEIGYDALVNIAPLQKVAKYILHHHERFDGTGYPDQKKGTNIPLVARVLSVADVYEALTADRVYRQAMNIEQALLIMNDGKGTQFDPIILEALFAVLEEQGIDVAGCVAKDRSA